MPAIAELPEWRVKAAPGTTIAKAKADFGAATTAAAIEFFRKARNSGVSEPANQSQTLDVGRVQSALRAAERGNTWLLMAIYRDMVLGYSHLQSEWAKRKSVIIGQPYSLTPYEKDNPDDESACEIIRQMIDNCRNWEEGLTHLLDATLYPLSVAEKIYESVDMSEQMTGSLKYPVQFLLKELAPVSYMVLDFQISYLPSTVASKNSAMNFNPDDWEAWLRFYSTEPTGAIRYSNSDVYAPMPLHHVVHRGNILSPTIPPNWGGQMRCILFWWLLSTQDRDWWGLMMNKYGMPLIVGKADAAQVDTVAFLRQAFALASQIGGLVVPKDAEVELQQMAATDGSNAHKIFSDFCNCEVSKIVLGQVLSSTPKNTGLGSGMAEQAEGVRNDLRIYDQTRLNNTLRKQVFSQYLRVNNLKGRAPHISWGGFRPSDMKLFTQSLSLLFQSGHRPAEESLDEIGQQMGFVVERLPDEMLKSSNPEKNKTGKEANNL